jgi:DNA-binding response OmpR family regulator
MNPEFSTSFTSPGGKGPPRPRRAAAEGEAGLPAEPGHSRILIVEDNYFVGLTIENALVDAGYEVLGVVDSGEDALERARNETPHLVLMDIRLAGKMDGIEAAIALRALGITCVMASAHSDADMKRRGAEAQPAGWLVKPFSDADLVAAVQLALRPRTN